MISDACRFVFRIDKLLYKPVSIDNWIAVIYESRRHFNERVADKMVTDLVRGCEAVGMDPFKAIYPQSC